MDNLGVRVDVKFAPNSMYYRCGHTSEVLRNVTEIHYNYRVSEIVDYDSLPQNSYLREQRIAFESDVHNTGINYAVADILEFETSLEHDKAEDF